MCHLDELIDVANGWDVVWNEWLERRFQLAGFWSVLRNTLEQASHLVADWQVCILVRVVAT